MFGKFYLESNRKYPLHHWFSFDSFSTVFPLKDIRFPVPVTYKGSPLAFSNHNFTMKQNDVLNLFEMTPVSRSVKPLKVSDRSDAFETMALQHLVLAFITFMEPDTFRVFFREVSKNFFQEKIFMQNFKTTISEAKTDKAFKPNSVYWDKVARRLLLNPSKKRKNTDTRLGFKLENMFMVKANFTFGQRTVEAGFQHIYQTTDVPMLCYVLPNNPERKPCRTKRNLVPNDQFIYNRFVFKPHSVYSVPPETVYVILTVQKTIFSFDKVKSDVVVKNAVDCKSHKKYQTVAYAVPPPTPTIEFRGPTIPNAVEPMIPVVPTFQEPVDHLPVIPEPIFEEPVPIFQEPVEQMIQESVPVFQEPIFQEPMFPESPPVFTETPPVFQETPPIFPETVEQMIQEPVFPESVPVFYEPVPDPVFKKPFAMDFSDMDELFELVDETKWGEVETELFSAIHPDLPLDLSLPKKCEKKPGVYALNFVNPLNLSVK